jgi:hypothetical protein
VRSYYGIFAESFGIQKGMEIRMILCKVVSKAIYNDKHYGTYIRVVYALSKVITKIITIRFLLNLIDHLVSLSTL